MSIRRTNMNFHRGFVALLVFSSLLFSSQEQYDLTVRNIVVPLRVFEGEHFIDTLSLSDFELFEDGEAQKIEALYLIKKTQVARREGSRDYNPITARRFYFLFQITDYNPKISDSIHYFFQNIYTPADQVVVMTPLKNYTLSSASLKHKRMETIVAEMQNTIRRDTNVGLSEYNSLIADLREIVTSLTTSKQSRGATTIDSVTIGSETDPTELNKVELLLPRYRDTLQNLEEIRLIDEKKLIKFAQRLKKLRHQKYIYFFYQREFRPELHPTLLDRLLTETQDKPNVREMLIELFQSYHRNISIDTQQLVRAFADSSALFNIIFFDSQPRTVPGIYMREQSEDLFRILSQIAVSTGGFLDSAYNPETALVRLSNISNHYYLLYYSPKDYLDDGRFRKIEVYPKNKALRVSHRIGYYATK